MIVWLDGRIVPAAEARVSVLDHGVTVGDGVFETLKVVRGAAFAARRHLDRLRRSAAGLGLEVPYDDDELRGAIDAVIDGTPGIGRVRLTVTGGMAPLGSGRGEHGPTTIVAGGPLEPWPATTAVVTVPWPRNERSAVAGLKTTSYAENVVALAHAHERGAAEAIFANTRGELCEGTGSNVFVVLEGRYCTPPLSSGCLAGVTRDLLCELLEVDEGALPIDALHEASEVFLTSSTRDVQPVDRVDDRQLDAPGELSLEAQRAFADLVARTLDP